MTTAATRTPLPPASAPAWPQQDAPAARPQQSAPAAWPLEAEPFPIGAHLITPRCGYTHHGIYIGSGRVVHYAGLSRAALTRRPVEEVSLTDFAGDCGVAVLRDSPLAFAPADVVARATPMRPHPPSARSSTLHWRRTAPPMPRAGGRCAGS